MKRIFLIIFLLFGIQMLSAQESPKLKFEDKHVCLNCGMKTDQAPNWEQKITTTDGHNFYFDGARCMFRILLDSTKTPANLDQILVKDYYTLEYFDAREAYYVTGSDVLGPMGNELIPFKTEAAAKEFFKDHKGMQIIRFKDVDIALIKKLAGKMHMH